MNHGPFMDSTKGEGPANLLHIRTGSDCRTQGLTPVNRRGWLKLAEGGGVGLALDGLSI